MSKRDPRSLTDGITTLGRGVNSGLPPVSIGRDQLAWAINCTVRGGYATNRPGMTKLGLQFLTQDGALDNQLQFDFQTAIFQGAIAFERRNQLVTMIGGKLFRISLDNWNVVDVSVPNDPNPTNRYRAWFDESEDFVKAQDGQSAPIFYDGAKSVRSDSWGINGPKQIPAGQAMVYSQGRVICALTDPHQFIVGDIVNGDSGTPAYNFRDAVLYVTENDVLNGGGAFCVPINAGELTAFRPVAQVDTSTGQGPTQVFTTGGVFSLNTPSEREQWGNTNFPIGTVSMINSGSLSDRATVNVNGDIWYRALDGIRSFMVGRRDLSSWVNAPMSQEMQRVLKKDDKSLLSYASAALFDGRLLTTVCPQRNWGHGITHRGLAVIDFQPIAFLNTRVPPVWEGLWTGLRVLQVLSGTFAGVERCFIFALNASDSTIELWELTKNRISDNDGTNDVPIEWSFETCSLNFPRGTSPVVPGGDLQKLQRGLLYVDQLQGGTVAFTAQYRPDQDPCWHDWHTWSVCSNSTTCSTAACTTPQTLQTQYRKPFQLPAPTDTCDSSVGKPTTVGAEFQGRLQITGSVRIKRWEFTAYDQQEDVAGLCAANETCESVECSDCQSDYTYSLT